MKKIRALVDSGVLKLNVVNGERVFYREQTRLRNGFGKRVFVHVNSLVDRLPVVREKAQRLWVGKG